MNKPFLEIDAKDIIISPFELPVPDEYSLPKGFPNCCNAHRHSFELLEDYLEKFPNCCDMHRSFYLKFKFDKRKLYGNMPLRVLKAVQYTDFQILKVKNNEDWFDDITEYFDFAIRSFGQPTIGLHIYLELVELFIKKKENKLNKNQRNSLLKYLDELTNFNPKNETADLNKLYSIYQRWINVFPFELSFFKGLKKSLSKSLPIVKGVKKNNRYSGLVTMEVLKPKELVDSLYSKTSQILSTIDTSKLVNEGQISNANKIKVDFINQHHRLNQETLLNDFNSGEKKYIKTIKKWLDNEKKYFKEITPELKNLNLTNGVYSFDFKNNFDHVSEDDVYSYFYEKLVETKYISSDNLKEFILLAFDKNEIPIKKFVFNNIPIKKKIVEIFYDYFKNIAGRPYGKQIRYIKLLSDYFYGFNENTLKTNFSKTY